MLRKLTFKTALPEDGADERRNVSDCYLNMVTLCARSGALIVSLMTINKYEHNTLYVQY